MDLKTKIDLICKVTPKKPSLKVLAYAKIEDKTLECTDLDQYLRVMLDEVDDIRDGFIDVNLLGKTKNIMLSYVDGLINAKDFPEVPHDTSAAQRIDPSAIPENLSSFTYAAATDQSRGVLCGIHLDGDNTVAVDGHLLKVYTAPEVPARNAIDITITKSTAEIIDIIRSSGDPVILNTVTKAVLDRANKPYIRASCGDVTYTAQLIDDSFPDWMKVLPKEGSIVTLKTSEIQNIISAIGKLTPFTPATKLVRLEDNNISVVDFSKGQRYFCEVADGDIFPDLSEAIGFDAEKLKKTFQDILQNVSSDDVICMQYTQPYRAVVFSAYDFKWLIMPLKINNGVDILDFPAVKLELDAVKPVAKKKAPPVKKPDPVAEAGPLHDYGYDAGPYYCTCDKCASAFPGATGSTTCMCCAEDNKQRAEIEKGKAEREAFAAIEDDDLV
jgi:DNA polymerase III sliding clamp (beta) subunit (PCNA family)